MTRTAQRMPLGPLRDAAKTHGTTLTDVFDRARLDRSQAYRDQRDRGGLTPWIADRCAIHGLDMHPMQIWGPEWLEWEDRRTWVAYDRRSPR